jgi:F-type H+-transporting ATPase subunit b
MHLDWSTLALHAINALVLFWLLARFLFRPVSDIIAARQKAAQQWLDDTKAAKAAAEAERDQAAAAEAELARHRIAALKAAEAEAEKAKRKMLAAAQADADKLRVAAQADIKAARRAEMQAAGDRAARLAVDIAAKLLDRLPREARVAAFIDGIATGVAELPAGARASIGANGASIRLTVARAVTPEEIELCRKALAGVLGHPVAIEVTVEPELIAGLELEGPHAAVRNSFRADLARLKAELVRDDADLA